jgi:hypothetical protein
MRSLSKSLTKEGNDHVAQYRGEAQKKKNKKWKQKADNRWLAKAQLARDESAEAGSGEEEQQATLGAGSQFGANGNRISKKTKK